MIEIYAVRIDEPIEEVYKQFFSCVSEEKRERIQRFRFIEDAKRTLYGELLVRHLACDKLKKAKSEFVIDCNEFGKPFLREYPNFHFNISHSGDWVVCVISDKEVGVDIEKIKPIDLDLAKRFFSDAEYKMLMLQPEALKMSCFYDIWTLKESYIKYMGKGLSIPLNSFNVCIEKSYIPLADGITCLYFSRVKMDENYKLSVCSTEKLINKQVNIIKNYRYGDD